MEIDVRMTKSGSIQNAIFTIYCQSEKNAQRWLTILSCYTDWNVKIYQERSIRITSSYLTDADAVKEFAKTIEAEFKLRLCVFKLYTAIDRQIHDVQLSIDSLNNRLDHACERLVTITNIINEQE